MSKIHSKIRDLMKKKNITVRGLQSISGLSLAAITKARTDEGITECKLSTLVRIANALGVGTKALYEEAKGEAPAGRVQG